MNLLIHPTYFPSISHFVAMAACERITFEMEDNYQKQTNRNRMYIYSPNGIQLLNIPIKHSKEIHQKTKDVKLESAFDWQRQHFKSLEAAYRSSPFFEFYEAEIMPIYNKKHIFLMDLNIETIEIVTKCLRTKFDFTVTTDYLREPTNCTDYRLLVDGKKDKVKLENYKQVFDQKHGIINNLSILDLLFNEGNFAFDYLKNQKKKLIL